MPSETSFAQAIVLTVVELAPAFLVVCVFFLILTWVRLLLDYLSGARF